MAQKTLENKGFGAKNKVQKSYTLMQSAKKRQISIDKKVPDQYSTKVCCDSLSLQKFSRRRGSSVVEREPEELSVVGSIPTLGTSLRSLTGTSSGKPFF